MKVWKAAQGYRDWTEAYCFTCPGCGMLHEIPVKRTGKGVTWEFNGNLERPTFQPSLLVEFYDESRPGTGLNARCHSFIRDGRIEFCADSTHDLAGKTVPMEDADK